MLVKISTAAIAYLFFLHKYVSFANASDVSVVTTEGTVVGNKLDGRECIEFYGIPYAGVTSAGNRFKAPTPPPQHEKELFAREKTNITCIQPSPSGVVGTEDCLTLDIHTKNVTKKNPVLVWLSGEDYVYDNEKDQFSYISMVEADLVVVAVNYRLSIFGFLCLGIEEAPGNAGLKDVVAALNWLNKNVAAFGGDPDNIVLLGHGSGAAMVDLMTMSPLSKNLFHKAIALSGSALSPWAVALDPDAYTRAFASSLGYGNMTNVDLAKSLQQVDANKLITQINSFKFRNNTLMFSPCVENQNLSGPFLIEAPLKILRSGSFHHVPYITGYVNLEGTLRIKEALSDKWLEDMVKNFTEFLPADLIFKNESVMNKFSKKVYNLYFGEKVVSREGVHNVIEYEGDISVIVPVVKTAIERKNKSSADVRLLEFGMDENPDPVIPFGHASGTIHGHIMDYIFDRREVAARPKRTLSGRIIAFAKTGTPNSNGRNNGQQGSTKWLPMNEKDTYFFFIKGDITGSSFSEGTSIRPIEEKWSFWSDIYNQHYRAPKVPSAAVIHRASTLLLAIIILLSFNFEF